MSFTNETLKDSVLLRNTFSLKSKKIVQDDSEERKQFLANLENNCFDSKPMPLLLKKKRYVIVTKWGYPFGGGEAFMFQTIKWALSLGMEPFWISFCLADNRPYQEFSSEKFGGANMIHIQNGFDPKILEMWLRFLKPHIVHHQGHLRMEILDVCKTLMIPFVTGYHFWLGLIELDSTASNTKIIENAALHKVSPDYLKLLEYPNASHYVVSPYMQHAVKRIIGSWIDDIILPVPDMSLCTDEWCPEKNNQGFVLQINIHKLKGGEIFLKCVESLPEFPFMAVRTEHMSDELDAKIKSALLKTKQGVFKERTEDVKSLYRGASVLLAPSLVDETFCRVVLEAMYNGIPVITTGYGNIVHIVGDAGLILDDQDMSLWIKAVKLLKTNTQFYNICASKIRKRASLFNERYVVEQFEGMMTRCLNYKDGSNIAFFTPWGDQGLGIQCRNYNGILSELGFKTHVFAFASYFAKTPGDRHQKNPQEWVHPRIYYSPNVREKVLDDEVVEFIHKYRISKVILPETCWGRVFEIAALLRTLGVKCYAVPNLEIVRKDELHLHHYFYGLLMNNQACQKAFEDRGFKNAKLIRYSIPPPRALDQFHFDAQIAEIESSKMTLRFICLGGMNAFTRKQVLEVCEAAVQAYEMYKANIHVTCTVQGQIDPQIEKYKNYPFITIIQDHLSYEKILDMYVDTHINIQVSKHEGLGLGFYESISMSTPVITLDTAPHNEIVTPGKSGWILPCTFKPMLDNTCGIIESAYFDPKDLAQLFKTLDQDRKGTAQIYRTTMQDYHEKHSIDCFKKHFYEALQN